MSWFDDLQARVQQSANQGIATAENFFASQVRQQGVSVVNSVSGGLTAQANQSAALAAAQNPDAVANSVSSGMAAPLKHDTPLILVLAVGIAVYFFAKKGRK